MKIKAKTMGILILAIFVIGTGSAMATGLWATESKKIPSKYEETNLQDTYNPADIRGSYEFSEVAKLFEIDMATLFEAFGLPPEAMKDNLQSKDLESIYENAGVEIGNKSVQIFVALYKGLPIELDGSFLPEPAVDIIIAENENLTEEERTYLTTHTYVGTEAINTDNIIPEGTDPAVTSDSEPIINGAATFQVLLDAGITKEEIKKIIGAPMPLSNKSLKDYCNEEGLSFTQVKDQLNALI
ncbi:MAG: hypothetical protein JJE49_07250 [Peptostreptococcaceae bacterium]|nr:hypothetical protein [Peptostreptococcaceae bacterium]